MMQLTAPDLLRLGVIDDMIPEPEGGAHTAPVVALRQVDRCLHRHLAELPRRAAPVLPPARYQNSDRWEAAAPDKEEQ